MSTVATFDISQPIIVTPDAARHLKQQLRREGSLGVRIGVRDSGCSGYKHVLEPVTDVPAGVLQQQVDDELTLYVDQDSLPLISGTTLRFVREGLNEQIQFDNPRAGDYCGCGESFTADSPANL